MAIRSTRMNSCTRLLRDRGGNFGILAAIVLPLTLASGGVAIDMTNMVMAKNQLQDATDAAALSAASALVNQGVTQDEAKALAIKFLKAQMSNSQSLDETGAQAAERKKLELELTSNTKVDIAQKATLGNSKAFAVTVSSSHSVALNPLTSLLGKKTIDVATTSTSASSTETKNAVSMYLVLDRSGSMAEDTATVNKTTPTRSYTYDCSYTSGGKKVAKTCTGTETNYISKIDALKTATANLLTVLKTADTTSSLVRTGGVSYNSAMQTPTPLAWGTSAVLTYVNALTATGGTDSSAAFTTGYNGLMAVDSSSALNEEKLHKAKNGQVPKKYIVFMTDGENNYFGNKSNTGAGDSSDTETLKYCKLAKTAGITVYTIAFMAPDRGKKLLSACSSGDTYYFAAENADQLSAAFKYIGEKASALSVRLTQ